MCQALLLALGIQKHTKLTLSFRNIIIGCRVVNRQVRECQQKGQMIISFIYIYEWYFSVDKNKSGKRDRALKAGDYTSKQECQGIKYSSSQSCEDKMTIYRERKRERERQREINSNSVQYILSSKEVLAVVAVIFVIIYYWLFSKIREFWIPQKSQSL